jgi:hypothetical protein
MTPVKMLAAALLVPALILTAVGAVLGAIVRWRVRGGRDPEADQGGSPTEWRCPAMGQRTVT